MEAYISITILIMAVLIKRNYELAKKLKQEAHSLYNLRKLTEKNEELVNANENLAAEIRRQRVINYSAINSYNELRDSIIDMPLKSGRFFSVKLTNNHTLKHFSEN